MLIFVLLCQFASSNYIAFESFTPVKLIQATTTSTYSHAQVGLYTNTGEYDLTDGVVIYLSLSPASTLLGTTTCTTSYGSCVFNYNVLSKYSGTFYFIASASGYTSGSSSYFSVTGTNAFNTVSVTSSSASPSAYFSFTISVYIYDSAGSYTTNSCSVSLSESGGSAISGTSSSTITGSGSFSIYLTAIGAKTIVATCGSITGSTSITILTQYLKVITYSPPTTSLTIFSITVGVYDNSRTIIESARGVYSVTIELSPAGTLSGTYSGTTSAGQITFSNLRILSSGTFSIRANSANILSATSVSTTVTNYVNSITLSSTSTTPTMNFSFKITATLKSEDLALYAVTVTVTLSESSNCLVGTKVLPTSTGSVEFTLYCSSIGSKSILASVPASGSFPAVSQSIAISVQSLKLVFGSYSPTPTTSLSIFSVSVSVYDSTGTTVESSRGPYSVSISLSPTATTAGTWTTNTVSGVASYTSLRIITGNTYTLTATSSGITSATSSLTITSYLHSITLTSSNSSPTVGFLFSISGSLKNEDASSFTGSCSMTLTETSGSIAGTVSGSNSGGSVSFSIYFTSIGSKIISTSCPASGSFPQVVGSVTINVLTLILKITSFTPPANSLATFSVTVGVYDNSGVSIETLRGPYSITLSLTPTGTFSGTLIGSTSSGSITFSSLRILTWNTFTLTASSTGITSAVSTQFTTINYVHTIALSASTTTPSMNFLFSISVGLFGEDGGTFTGSCIITLTESTSSLVGTLSNTVSGGSGSFSVYCNSVGSKSIVATCPASGANSVKTQTIVVNCLTLILKLTPTTPSISNSLNIASLTIGVYDNSGTNLETLRGPYSISLSLSPTGSIAGTFLGSTSSGVITFSSIRIISAGSFSIIASSSGITSDQTTTLTIKNYVYTITLTTSTSTPSVNFEFTITGTLKGEDGNLFLRSCTVTLSEVTNSLAGTISLATATGTASFAVYLTKIGAVTIVATCPGEDSSPVVTGSISITALTLILKITSFTPPANSLATFSVTVGVYDNSGVSIETLRGPYPITLSISPTGTISGVVTASTSSGSITFSSLRILTWNTFTLTASSTSITSGTSTQFTTTNYVHTITLSASTTTPSMNFLFSISVGLFGEDGGTFTGSCIITLTESTSSLVGTLSNTVSGGSGSFSVYSNSVGIKSIVATCPASGSNTAKTQTISITVQSLSIKVTSTPATPTTSLVAFSLSLGVYDNSGTTVESLRGPYSVSISLSPTGTFSGVTTASTTNGLYTFSSLRILSAGTFTIIASSSQITSGSSASIIVTNYVHSMTLTSSIQTPTVNFLFTLTATLLGEDSQPFTGSCTLTLSESTSALSGTLSGQNSLGQATFSVYFISAGASKVITATCPSYNSYPSVSAAVTLTSLIQTLKIGSFSPIPSTSLNTFSITIGVYDSTGTNIESTRGPYSITISLTTAGTLSGTLSLSTTSGQAIFSSLRILSAGTFSISASSSGLNSVTTQNPVSITNYVYSMTIASSTLTPSVNFAFTLTISLKGEDLNTFTGVCSLSLTESGNTLAGSLTGSISGGSGNLIVYFTTSGSKTVVGTCPSVDSSPAVTATISLTALSLKLVISSFSAPAHSLSVFSISVQVYDNTQTTIETLRGPYDLSLSISPIGTMLGSLSTTTTVNTGQGTFSSLRILSSNTFTLTVSAIDMVSATSSQFTMTNFAYTIVLESSTLTPSVNFDFIITATVKGEDGNLFTGACTISLSTSDSSLVGELNKPITNSVSLLTVYFISIGSKTVTASCPASGSSPAVYQTIQLTCLINKLTVSFNTPLPTLSTGYLSLTVKVYDNSLNTIESARGGYSITLTLSSGSLTGTISGNTVSGQLTISDLRILSSGTFTITASSPDITSGTSPSISITNLIHTIELSSSTLTPTINFEFTLTATLKGEDQNLFTGSCQTTITETGGSTISGLTSKITSTGTALYNIYFTTLGNKVIQATCSGVVGSISLTVPNLELKITTVNPTPLTSRDLFQVIVGVYDSTLNSIESNRGPYNIILALSPTGSFSGVVSLSTTNGIATFNSIRILTAGTFSLQATSTGIATAALGTSITITNFVYTIIATSSTYTPSKNFAFDITVTLKSEDGLTYLPTASVSLAESLGETILGYSPGSSLNGVIIFSIHFETIGVKNLVVTCNSINSDTVTITVLDQTLKLTLSNIPTTSLTSFDVIVGVYDSDVSLIENSNKNYIISLALTPTGTLSGVLSTTSTGGISTFSSLRILSNGQFKIIASCPTLSSIESSILSIQNYAYSMNIESSTALPSVNFAFTVTVTMTGEDLQLFLNSCTVSLTETGGSIIGGISTLTTLTGIASFSIYFDSAGAKTIKATCPASGLSPEVSNTVDVTVLSLALKIDSILPLPTSSTDETSITVSVRDNSKSLIETLLGPYSVSLTLTPSGSKIGGWSGTTTNGQVVFTALRILSQNTFTLTASSTDIVSDNYISVTIIKELYSITLESNTPTPSSNFDFVITATLMSEDGSAYDNPCTVNLIGNNLAGTLNKDNLTGSISFTIRITLSGSHTITAKSLATAKRGEISAQIIIPVQARTLKVSTFTITPTTSLTVFGLTVSVYNELQTIIESNYGPYTINLALSPTGVIDGVVNQQTTSGVATFSGLRVLSAGDFNIIASALDMSEGTSAQISVTNFVFQVILTVNPIQTVAFPFEVLINLNSEDLKPYASSASISLYRVANNADTLIETLSTSNGVKIFTVTETSAGAKTFKAVCSGVTDTKGFVVNEAKLKITSISPNPSLSTTSFSVTVAVYNDDFTLIESTSGIYSINIVLEPNSGVISGTTTKTSSAGIAVFSSLRILSSGTYTITASSNNIVPVTTIPLTIMNFVYSIIATPSKSVVKAYEYFKIDIELYGEDQKLFILPANIILTEKNSEKFNSPDIVETSNGKASVRIYFYETGSKILQVSVGLVVTEVLIKVNDLENPDIKCKKSSSSAVCTECVAGAILFDGICNCSVNSEYSFDDRECLCFEGYQRVNDYCVKCGKYYSGSDITGKFSNDFSSISLTFSVQPVENLPCEEFLMLPSTLEFEDFYCMWDNILTLSIRFKGFPHVEGLVIGIDPFKIQKTSQACSLKIEKLDIIISYTGSLPIPLASISAPDKVSLTCSKSDLHINTPNNGRDYKYTWSGTYSPSNSIITDLLKSLNGTSIKLPISQLTLGTLYISLTISSKSLQTSSTVTKMIEIVSDPHLTIELSSSSMISIKKSSNLSIKPLIKESCGKKSSYSYAWTYITENVTLDFSGILLASSNSNNLLIRKNTLESGKIYEFMVTVSDEAATGSASVKVVVEQSPLVVYFSRSSGKIGNDDDFYIYSTVTDPDSSSSVISYKWSCSEQASECLDGSGKALLENTDKDYIFVDKEKLRNTAVYVFSLEVSTATKSQSMSIEIEVKSGLKGQVYIQKSHSKLNVDSDFAVIPTVTGTDPSIITWKLASDDTSTISKGLSFINIPANTLTAGVSYEMELSFSENNGVELTTIYSFSTNSPATCESLNYELISAKKITLTGENCVDGDDSDYPLTYQFGLNSKETMQWVSSAIFTEEFSFLVQPEAVKGYIKVCDSLYSCSLYSTSILTTTRNLDEISDSFEADILDIDSIPSAIIYYSAIATKDTVEKMTEKLTKYIEANIIDSSELDLITNTAYSLFNSKTSVTASQANTIINLLTSKLQNLDFELTDSQVISIYSIADSQAHLITTKNMRKLISAVRNRWINNKVPYSEVTFTSTLFISHIRGLQSDYKNLLITSSNLNLTFPEQFLSNSTSVIDISFAKYYEKNSPIFELQVFISGKYENYTLNLESPEYYITEFLDSLRLDYESSEFSLESTCQSIDYMNWTKASCTIQSISESGVKMDLSQSSIFTLAKVENSLFLTKICMFIIYGVLFYWICILVFIYFCDKSIERGLDKKTLISLYPISSIMIPQARPWRLFQALHIVSSQSLLLLLIGGFYFYFPQEGGLIISNTSKSGISLCLSQAFSLSSQIIIFSTLKHKKINSLVYSLTLIVTLVSYTGITLITFQHPGPFITNWICGYLLYSPIDIIIIQFIYSLILSTRPQTNLQVTSYFPNNNRSFEDSPSKLEYSNVINLRNDSDEEIILKKRDKKEFDSTALSVRGITKEKADEMKRYKTYFN